MLDYHYSPLLFAQNNANYSEGVYGGGVYNPEPGQTTQANQPPSGDGSLANTGMDVFFTVALALVIMGASGAWLISSWYRRTKKT